MDWEELNCREGLAHPRGIPIGRYPQLPHPDSRSHRRKLVLAGSKAKRAAFDMVSSDRNGLDVRTDAMKWHIGDVTVTKIVELEMTGGTRFLLPQATREEVLTIPWLVPHFADAEGRLTLSIHALVIETPIAAHRRRHLPWQ